MATAQRAAGEVGDQFRAAASDAVPLACRLHVSICKPDGAFLPMDGGEEQEMPSLEHAPGKLLPGVHFRSAWTRQDMASIIGKMERDHCAAIVVETEDDKWSSQQIPQCHWAQQRNRRASLRILFVRRDGAPRPVVHRGRPIASSSGSI